MVYYNEFDEATAKWLQGLINNGCIPYGIVDTRSIEDIDPQELTKYTQCHFFAGIGGWAYALMLANVPSTLNIYTGSCPCQPFSIAGKQEGFNDKRNLWKVFYDIIKENKPTVVVGEQVATAINFGWLDIVQDDLEKENYATGSAVLTASMLGAPHTRKRLYWGAIQESALENTDSIRQDWKLQMGNQTKCSNQLHSYNQKFISSSKCFWNDGTWQTGTNGKSYLFQSRNFPLVNGVPNRMVKCRGYGNAIVPQVGAEFVKALLGI